jgi:hypothetical protein
MAQAPQRTAVSGPTLVRLLARLTDADVPASGQSLSDQLSQWLGWTDAIALSTALNGHPPAVASTARAADGADGEGARVRASLAAAIDGDGLFGVPRLRGVSRTSARSLQRAQQSAPVEAATDFADFRQRYIAMQQSMETAIGTLRGRLRGMLAARTPEMTRLAVVDAIIERSLGARERSLLAAVPGMLGTHFERLRKAAQVDLQVDAQVDKGADDAPTAPQSAAWLDTFRQDARSVLLAEMDIRFQPVEGLLAALRIS